MRKLLTIAAICIASGLGTLIYWRVTIHEANAAPPVPSAQIPDWGTLWQKAPFLASGFVISGARPFHGSPNDVQHTMRTYLRLAAVRDRSRFTAWTLIVAGFVLTGIVFQEMRKNKTRQPNQPPDGTR